MSIARKSTFDVGVMIHGEAKEISISRTRAAAGGPFDSPEWPIRDLHTDDGLAQASGLRAQIGAGTALHGYVLQVMMELFGEEWLLYGSTDIRYLRSFYVGETVRAYARVTVSEPGRIGMDVWVENDKGEKILAGASVFDRDRD
jgi:hypothetical protein